jgi:outer membrane lipoprotein-sorting protein
MRRGRSILLAVLLVAGFAFPVTPEQTAANLEKTLRSLRSLQVRFDQLYFSPSVPEPLHERGQLYLRKPDQMRWQYKDPQEKVFLYAGGLVQMYLPEEKQLTRSRIPPEAYESDILGIFLGAKSFRDLYVIEDARFPTDTAGVHQVKLTPRQEGDYSHILLEVDGRTWLLRRVIFFEWAGNRREFQFTAIRTNASLPPGTFELKVPPETEVIDDTGTIKR